jgi:hypothetical protein
MEVMTMKKMIMVCEGTKARYMVEVETTAIGAVIKNTKNSLMAKIVCVVGSEVFVKSYKGKVTPKGLYRIEKKTSGVYLFQKSREEHEAAWVGGNER